MHNPGAITAQAPSKRYKLTLDPAVWRHELLQLGLLVGLVFGGFVYLPSVWIAFLVQRWGIVFIDTFALLLIAGLYMHRQAAYRLRAAAFAMILYILGIWLLVEVGSIGLIYLLGFSILASLLLGLRISLLTVGLNGITLIGFGALKLPAPGVILIGQEMNAGAWFVVSLNFLLINSILVVSVGVVLAVLEGIAEREYEARISLERERAELVQANVALDREILERKLLERQLAQSQKMEAVGQLAGGVAHDFNNLLMVINGYSDVMLSAMPASDDDRFMLEEIHAAGTRAADLTRQLLAFSRRQMLMPQLLDLNTVVRQLETLLRRLISENIRIIMVLRPELPQIRVDPSQLEQVIINLALNARDAMPSGGTLTIESADLVVPAEQAARQPELAPGAYVTLIVHDTGSGMPPDVQERIFEPFFTTKEVGKGTGLGLATVFGIVKQSDAHIDVSSEMGLGTRFCIYFPAFNAAAQPVSASAALPHAGCTGEL